MNEKEILENLQLNEKDKKTGIVLIFIASLLAFVTAIYGAFRFGKKKGADAERSSGAESAHKSDVKRAKKAQRKSRKTTASKKSRARSTSNRRLAAQRRKSTGETQEESAPVVYRSVAPQPVYVVRPIQEKKPESRGKRFRRHICAAAAAILVISMVGSTTMQNVDSPTALAKDSFSGIGQIVKDHDDGDPYKILDIVPVDATYTLAANPDESGSGQALGTYSFNVGTMGYLVNGQAPIISDLHEGFKENKAYSYEMREKLIDSVLIPGTTLGVTYQEAYAGVDNISENGGWIEIFGKMDVPDEDSDDEGDDGTSDGSGNDEDEDSDDDGSLADLTYATGRFYGKFEQDDSGDYEAINRVSMFSGDINMDASGDELYTLNEFNGKYRVRFEFDRVAGSEEMAGGYVAAPKELLINAFGSYPYTSCVYELRDGVYYYRGTIAGILGVDDEYDISGGEDETEPGVDAGAGDDDEDDDDIDGDDEDDDDTDGDDENEGDIEGDGEDDGEDDDDTDDDDENAGNNPGDSNGGDGNNNGGGTGNNDGGGTGDGNNNGGGDNNSADNGSENGGNNDGDTGNNNGNGDGGSGSGVDAGSSSGLDVGARRIVNGGSILASNSLSSGNWQRLVEDGEIGENSEIEEVDLWARWQDTIGSGGYENYWIVGFEYKYRKELVEGQYLYKVAGVEKITNKNVSKPYDSYDEMDITENAGEENPEYSADTLEMQENMAVIPYANEQYPETDSDVVKFRYVGANNGHYKLTRADKNADGASLIEVQGAPVYFRCTSNCDWLKEYVFSTLSGGDNENKDFEIKVTTKRADQVTAAEVKEADLIFLESGLTNTVLNTTVMSPSYIGDAYDDMSDAAVKQILACAAKDLTPVIVDYDIVKNEDNYKESNYQYLAKALLKEYLEEFYDKMDENGNFMVDLKMNVKDSDDFPVYKDNGYNYVNRNVYIVNDSSPLVSEDFHDSFSRDVARAGFSEVLEAIRAENWTLAKDDQILEEVSKARAVQYIINYSVGIIGEYDDLRILEIQPSANLTSDLTLYQDDKGTKLLWKTESMTTAKQILSSKKEFNVTVDVKSVVEFNGEWEDINGTYDMIFIGLDGKRLNQDDNGKAIYNNSALDGNVYHKGDDSNSNLGKYDANDLTGQKMEALLEFMSAGYPVVVENNCFKDDSAQKAGKDGINYDYIQKDSVMDHFLQTAVGDYPYYDCIYSVSDVMSSPMFTTQVRISKPRISLVDKNGEETSRVQSIIPDENGEYHGEIYYKIESSKGGDYVGNPQVKVYADYNYDGYFIPTEEVTEFVSDGNMLEIQIDGMGPGVLPYKLEVSDSGNPDRRDSVQGYFQLESSTAKDEMKVLQITESSEAAVNLQRMFDRVENSMLASYLHGAETTLNIDMLIESVTASQLEDRLEKNAKYLEQWDVVVLTLDDAAGSSDVAEAVSQYVDSGRSLLVCGQDPGDQRAGLSANLLGQVNEDIEEATRTFVNIGGGGASGKLRYKDLDYSMFDGKTLLKAEPVNEGSISFYPYPIDGSFTFGETGDLKAAPYLLNFDDNLKTESATNSFVTAWYTFGSDDRNGSAYGISPKDARNNYYCYSKGNVVYLAQSKYDYYFDDGHGLPSSSDAGSSECRLFVNALFAAYNAGLHNAHINIVAGFAPDAADVESISVPFDDKWLEPSDDATADITGGILDNTVDVYFKFRDNNIAAQKTTLIGFYRQASDDEEGVPFIVNGEEVPLYVNGEKVEPIPFTSDIWTVTDGKLVQVAGDELQPGKVYRIEAPVITLQNLRDSDDTKNKADIYIVLLTTFERNGHRYDIISADAVSLNRARLFRLE